MINAVDYNNYDNNGRFDFDPFKCIICIILAFIVCGIIDCCNSCN